jgi:hypothetical protein
MEYYGLRPHGDIDFIVSDRDFEKLRDRYPNNRKDQWGDFGIVANGFDMFRSIYRFDYDHYSQNAIEYKNYNVVAVDMLFRMKVFAMETGEKHKRDVQLLKQYYETFQNSRYKAYLDAHVPRYLAAEDGIILNGTYDEDLA